MSLKNTIDKRIDEELSNDYLLENIQHLKDYIHKRGVGFMFYVLRNVLSNLKNDEIENGIVDSLYRKEKHDYGIDAIYLLANGNIVSSEDEISNCTKDTKFELCFFQFKNSNGLDQEALIKLKNGLKKILIDENCDNDLNSYLFEYLSEFNDIKHAIYNTFSPINIIVNIYICFAGSKPTVIKDTILNGEIKDIEDLLESESYNNKIFILGAQEIINNENKKPDFNEVLGYLKSFKYLTGESQDTLNGYICLIKAEIIAEMVKKSQGSLFEANIRDYYNNNPINQKILSTCSDINESRFFWGFNNGLTITCSRVEELPNDKYRLFNPQIVNGCQTSNTIYNAYNDNKLESNTTILVKIIETSNEELIYRITETTNSQNSITIFNLQANETIHKNIENYFKDYNIYYERRVNYYKNQKKSPLIDIKKLAQIYNATMNASPSESKAHPRRMFNDKYLKIFPNPIENSNINYDEYLLPTKLYININMLIDKIRRNKEEKDEYKVSLMAHGKFHILCLTLYGIIGEKLTKKSFLKNKAKITNAISNEATLQNYIQDALTILKKISIAVSKSEKKELVLTSMRLADLDTHIKKTVLGSDLI